jgi:hypothetical protein
MKRLIVALMLCLVAACVGPNGVSPSTRSVHQAPPPEPTTAGRSYIARKPLECASCNADMRRRLGNCSSISSSCMANCSGTDPLKNALCQSNCQSQYASCAQYASMPNDCPAYCAL